MPSNGLDNSARSKPALLVLLALSGGEGSAVQGPALLAPRAAEGSLPKGRSERIRGTEVPANMAGMLGEMPVPPSIPCETGTGIPRPHPAVPKLNANRGTNLLAIVLTHWKQRPTTLSNRHKIQFTNAPFLRQIPGLIRL